MLSFLLFAAGLSAQQQPLQPQHLAPLVGSWNGELEYLDYGSHALTRIPATLLVEPLGARSWRMGFGYTAEPHANEMDTVVLAEDGRTLDGQTVVWVEQPAPDSVWIHLSSIGDDDGHPSAIARTWTAGPHGCTLLKEVRHLAAPGVTGDAYFVRHIYRFRR